MKTKSQISLIIFSLVIIDAVLFLWGFLFPETWFTFFHEADYIDPQALLFRSAANWLAFFTIQLIALFKWKKQTFYILLVAGCRLGDTLTDITCLTFADNISIFGTIAFPIAGIGNLIVGIYLVKLYKKLNNHSKQDTTSL